MKRFIDATNDITEKDVVQRNLDRLANEAKRQVRKEAMGELNATLLVIAICSLIIAIISWIKY